MGRLIHWLLSDDVFRVKYSCRCGQHYCARSKRSTSLIHSHTDTTSQSFIQIMCSLAGSLHSYVCSFVHSFVALCFHYVIVTTLTHRVFILYILLLLHICGCVCVCVCLTETRVAALFCLVVVVSVGFCFRYSNSLISSHSSHSLYCVCDAVHRKSNRIALHTHSCFCVYAARYMHDVSYSSIARGPAALTRHAVR